MLLMCFICFNRLVVVLLHLIVFRNVWNSDHHQGEKISLVVSVCLCCRSSIWTVLFKCIVCVFGIFSNLEKLPGKCNMCFYNLYCSRSSISSVLWFKCIVWCVFGNFSNLEKLPGKCIMCLYNLYCRSFISTVWFKMHLTYEGPSQKGWV
jgi:hypothetical protein